MCTHDYGIVDLMRRRVVELNRGVLVRDEAQGAYATGQIPAIQEIPEVQELPEVQENPV